MTISTFQRITRASQASDSEIRERIFAMSSPEPNSGCWLWMGAVGHNGYGHMQFRGRNWRAHRVSYVLHHGEILDGLVVMHKCDNTYCINPAHLVEGTALENVQDKVAKGRQARGAGQWKARLTSEAVRAIRASVLPACRLAEIYSVEPSTVRAVQRGRTWAWVK